MTNHEQAINEELKAFSAVAGQAHEILGDTSLNEVGETRAETELPNVTPEQTEALYQAMEQLGFGRESDVPPAEAGMRDGYAVNIEGGKPNKILAELKVVLDSDVAHGPIVLTLSRDRKAGDDEREFLISQGIQSVENAETELQVGIKLLTTVDGFEETDPGQINFGYDAELQTNQSEYSGQAALIGIINDQPVYVLEVTRSYTEDGKYTQPSTADMLVLSTEMLAQEGQGINQIAVATGGLYSPTRRIDTAVANGQLASANNPVVAGTIAYGRNTMGDVTGKPSARPNEAQLFSEIKKLDDKLAKLQK